MRSSTVDTLQKESIQQYLSSSDLDALRSCNLCLIHSPVEHQYSVYTVYTINASTSWIDFTD